MEAEFIVSIVNLIESESESESTLARWIPAETSRPDALLEYNSTQIKNSLWKT